MGQEEKNEDKRMGEVTEKVVLGISFAWIAFALGIAIIYIIKHEQGN
jgi:protein involved in temperature-dependent protein secretion